MFAKPVRPAAIHQPKHRDLQIQLQKYSVVFPVFLAQISSITAGVAYNEMMDHVVILPSLREIPIPTIVMV